MWGQHWTLSDTSMPKKPWQVAINEDACLLDLYTSKHHIRAFTPDLYKCTSYSMSCRSAGNLFRSTGHNRLPYESDSIPNDFRLQTWQLILSNNLRNALILWEETTASTCSNASMCLFTICCLPFLKSVNRLVVVSSGECKSRYCLQWTALKWFPKACPFGQVTTEGA